MKKIIKIILLASFVLILGAWGKKENQKEITVYSSFEEDYLFEYIKEFNKDYPNIKVNITRDSSGVIAAKVNAEKANPKADVLWGVAATGLLKNERLFQSYDYDINYINKKFIDNKKEKPTWVGISAWMTAFTINNYEIQGKEIPKSYKELLKPEYKNKIIMPNPSSSGTGYLTVSAFIQLMGEEKAWEYMDNLNKNIQMYVHSGSAPTRMASKGETVIGIGMGFESLRQEAKNLPITTIFPKEGSGWEIEIVSLIKKENIKPEAKIFIEWSISKRAMELYAKNRGFVTDSRIVPTLKGYPKDINTQMIENDLVWAAENRDRILKEWEKRYGKGE